MGTEDLAVVYAGEDLQRGSDRLVDLPVIRYSSVPETCTLYAVRVPDASSVPADLDAMRYALRQYRTIAPDNVQHARRPVAICTSGSGVYRTPYQYCINLSTARGIAIAPISVPPSQYRTFDGYHSFFSVPPSQYRYLSVPHIVGRRARSTVPGQPTRESW
eukprot:3941201-Rhodomonas_salina.10